MSTEPSLYSALDTKAQEAATEWFRRMAPALEEGAQEWTEEKKDTFSEEETNVYWKVVHPVLLWRFYYHLSITLLAAANGWEETYRINLRDSLAERQGDGHS